MDFSSTKKGRKNYMTVYQFYTKSEGIWYQTTSRSVLRGMIEYYWKSIECGIVRVTAVSI